MRFLAVVGALAIVFAILAGTYFFSGAYSVAATSEDPAIVAWALTKVRTASIRWRAKGLPPVASSDPALVQAGARAFAQRGCPQCHGAPGTPWQKFAEGLNPDPPDLAEIAKTRTPESLFWVIKNGIRMTGMPSFAKAGASDQEISQIAAFVKKLPSVSDADYKTWTAVP